MSNYYSSTMDSNSNSNPNPSPNAIDISEFQLSDYLIIEDGLQEDLLPPNMVAYSENVNGGSVEFSGPAPRNSNIKYENEVKKNRVAFRTKSEVEIMDDGFKWRKYGKKMVKNSPNPRNYFKCLNGECNVKKRVERDSEDSSYVITTYEGVHNHESPCVVYYNQTPLMIPDGWTLQASSSHSSSS